MIDKRILTETNSFGQMMTELSEAKDGSGKKDLYLSGICLQASVKNHNGRVYPVHEIKRAVDQINETLKDASICGELNHPQDLQINLERASHMITEMRMDGANGLGKLKILPTPMGNLVKSLLEGGVKLGVSSRGSGNVDELTGVVSDFEIVTIDIVSQPSAPQAFPTAIYEQLMNIKNGHKLYDMSAESLVDQKVNSYLKKEMLNVIKQLKLR